MHCITYLYVSLVVSGFSVLCNAFPVKESCVCPKKYELVCGSDGKIYTNKCLFECHKKLDKDTKRTILPFSNCKDARTNLGNSKKKTINEEHDYKYSLGHKQSISNSVSKNTDRKPKPINEYKNQQKHTEKEKVKTTAEEEKKKSNGKGKTTKKENNKEDNKKENKNYNVKENKKEDNRQENKNHNVKEQKRDKDKKIGREKNKERIKEGKREPKTKHIIKELKSTGKNQETDNTIFFSRRLLPFYYKCKKQRLNTYPFYLPPLYNKYKQEPRPTNPFYLNRLPPFYYKNKQQLKHTYSESSSSTDYDNISITDSSDDSSSNSKLEPKPFNPFYLNRVPAFYYKNKLQLKPTNSVSSSYNDDISIIDSKGDSSGIYKYRKKPKPTNPFYLNRLPSFYSENKLQLKPTDSESSSSSMSTYSITDSSSDSSGNNTSESSIDSSSDESSASSSSKREGNNRNNDSSSNSSSDSSSSVNSSYSF